MLPYLTVHDVSTNYFPGEITSGSVQCVSARLAESFSQGAVLYTQVGRLFRKPAGIFKEHLQIPWSE